MKRGARATAIGATLGAGATGTLLLALWQTLDHYQKDRASQRAEASRNFEEVSEKLANFSGPCRSRLSPSVASKFAGLKLLREGNQLQPLEARGFDSLLEQVRAACAPAGTESSSAACPVGSAMGGKELCGAVVDLSRKDDYWEANEEPADQMRNGRNLIAGWLGLPPIPLEVPVQTAQAPVAVPVAPPPQLAAGENDPQAQAGAGPSVAATALASTEMQACAGVRLYIQIHDEASREPAQKLRERLQSEIGAALQVPPTENVSRSAELSKKSRPVPYTVPTLVLHEPAKYSACAQAIAAHIGEPWRKSGESTQPRIRGLPPRYPPSPGVIELWLPPLD